jgi:hypothetical protein
MDERAATRPCAPSLQRHVCLRVIGMKAAPFAAAGLAALTIAAARRDARCP